MESIQDHDLFDNHNRVTTSLTLCCDVTSHFPEDAQWIPKFNRHDASGVSLISSSCFEATKGLFWNGLRNFEVRRDDKEDTRDAPISRLTNDVTFNVHAHIHSGSSVEWVSELEPSSPEVQTLPLGHSGSLVEWVSELEPSSPEAQT
ncbi:hypothetical protein AVEN_79361-1, partial [Araneus ventricosus]